MFAILFTVTIYIGIILILRCICKNHISARLRYALWLLVAVKLLVFPVPNVEGYFSILGLVADGEGQALLGEEISEEALIAAEMSGQASEASQEEIAANGNLWGTGNQTGDEMAVSGIDSGTKEDFVDAGGNGFSKWERRQQILKLRLQNYVKNVWKAPVWIIFVWGAGSFVCALLIVVYHLRLKYYLQKKRVEPEWGKLFPKEKEGEKIEEKATEMTGPGMEEAAVRYKKYPAVYSIEGLPTPCLFGKSIYIPSRLAEDE